MKKAVTHVPEILQGASLFSCPGCHESLALRLVCEVIEEMELDGRTVLIPGGGCSAGWAVMDVDVLANMHGPGIALATALKRVNPETVVVAVQGDGELGAIGPGYLMNAISRAVNITIIALNNAVFGNTGGQMAPTTPLGMRTTTTPLGRDKTRDGLPFKGAELVAFLDGSCYSARVSVNTPAERQRAKKAVRTAFEKQLEEKGLSYVEFLCACPPNWHLDPVASLKYLEESLIPVFPLGTFKDV